VITTPFQKVLYKVARKIGMDPERNLQPNVAETLAGYITDRNKQAWEEYPWPEICPIEARVYRPAWDAERVYSLGDEVWDPVHQAYFVSLSDENQGNRCMERPAEPAAGAYLEIELELPEEGETDSLWWAKPTNLQRRVDFDQPGLTPIGDVLAVYRENPELNPNARSIGFSVLANSVLLGTNAPDVVWIEYRLRPPEFTATLWEATKIYQPDDVRYFAVAGDCYKALALTAAGESPVTTPSKWEKQPILKTLENSVMLGAYAEALEEDGQTDKAALVSSKATGRLTDAMERFNSQQGQTARFKVRGK